MYKHAILLLLFPTNKVLLSLRLIAAHILQSHSVNFLPGDFVNRGFLLFMMQRCFRNSTRGWKSAVLFKQPIHMFLFCEIRHPCPTPREPHLKMCNICHEIYNSMVFF